MLESKAEYVETIPGAHYEPRNDPLLVAITKEGHAGWQCVGMRRVWTKKSPTTKRGALKNPKEDPKDVFIVYYQRIPEASNG